jgi:hypothetical protein
LKNFKKKPPKYFDFLKIFQAIKGDGRRYNTNIRRVKMINISKKEENRKKKWSK